MLNTADRPQSPHGRARLDDVIAWIDGWAAPVAAEDVALAHAAGRVLACSIAATADLPPFDQAAADGFALRADETVGASAYNPLPFRLRPGGVGGAAAVERGDPLPVGADAVVRLEQATLDGPEVVAVIAPVFIGSEIERQGSHVARGGGLLASGRRLDPSDIGLLAAAGQARVSVVGRPRVRCLLAAAHAVEAGRALAQGEVYDADGPLLAALTERDGAVVVERRHVGRDRAALRDALSLPGADIILVVGGTGPGSGDHAAAALAVAGTLAVHGVALRPGETAGAGRVAGVPVFLLPGAPADCLWAYEFLAGRAIRLMAGAGPGLPYATETARTARKIVSEIGTVQVCPVRRTSADAVEPMPSFAEAGLTAGVHADGFVLVSEASEGYPQGATVTVHRRR